MHPMLNIAIRAARQAGQIITRALDRLDDVQYSFKAEQEYVSDVDKLAEQEITAQLLKAYPHHGVLGEEFGLQEGDGEHVWIIDPLDGTHNFINGFPHFCVCIALQKNNRTELGVIYDPIRQELFTAERGGGAQLNEKRLRVSPTQTLKNGLIATETGAMIKYPQLRKHNIITETSFRQTFQNDLKIWDIAAGALIVREAGGLVGDWHGEENYLTSGEILAASPKIYAQLINCLSDVTSQ